jgi:hypothetical protein
MERQILQEGSKHENPDSGFELERLQTRKEQHHVYQSREESNPLCRSTSSPEPGRDPGPPMTAEKPRNRPKRLRKALFANLLRWFCSVLFVVAIYVVLWHFSQQDVMSTETKREFNALIIGLSLGLGMSITISLEAMAVEIRWWILERRDWPKREVSSFDEPLMVEC